MFFKEHSKDVGSGRPGHPVTLPGWQSAIHREYEMLLGRVWQVTGLCCCGLEIILTL